jgi:hypothetical protein
LAGTIVRRGCPSPGRARERGGPHRRRDLRGERHPRFSRGARAVGKIRPDGVCHHRGVHPKPGKSWRMLTELLSLGEGRSPTRPTRVSAELESMGLLRPSSRRTWIASTRRGDRKVIEYHGNLEELVCITCWRNFPRGSAGKGMVRRPLRLRGDPEAEHRHVRRAHSLDRPGTRRGGGEVLRRPVGHRSSAQVTRPATSPGSRRRPGPPSWRSTPEETRLTAR